MARRTVTVKYNQKDIDAVLAVMGKIISEHQKDLADLHKSDLDGTLTEAMIARHAEALDQRTRAVDLRAQADELDAQAADLVGTAAGKTASSEDTVLWDVNLCRDMLKIRNRGKEEALERRGFVVQIGTAATPQRKGPTP